jgi:flagellar hook-associated protein 1 FlgK
MGTISSALSIISGALEADQEALNIVSNNVANASTTGYTKEVPNWEENSSVTINGVAYGQGVTNTGPTSLRDSVLTERLDQQQQLASSSSTRLTALDSIQALFSVASTKTTTGNIGTDLTSFYNTFTALEASPTNVSDREAVLSAAKTLASDISGAATSLQSQKSSLDTEAAGVTTQVNALTKSIAQLNTQIMSTSSTTGAGTLEDQREEDVNELSKLVGINQITTENNGVSITTTSGALLVSEGSSFDMTNGTVNGETHFFVGTSDITSGLTTGGGELGGYLTARDTDIPSTLGSLDQLAYGVETSVNALNNSGTDAKGVEGTGTNSSGVTGTGTKALYIFTQPTEVAGSAASMNVVMTDSNEITAASYSEGSGGSTNAAAMCALSNDPLVSSATTAFSVTQNLDSTTATGGTANSSVTVYDSLGNSYNAKITYTNEGSNSWKYSVSVPETLTADTSVSGQASYTFGTGETVDTGTSLSITGSTGASITAPAATSGESVADYVTALKSALSTGGVSGVTVTNTNGVVTIAGAKSTSGSVVADAVASSSASGTLSFNASGTLTSPSADVSNITFSGFSDGAATLNLKWNLYSSSGTAVVSQTASSTSQSSSSQNGSSAGDINQTPSGFYSSFVSSLGSTVSEVSTASTAQTASVTQLKSQINTLSGVNLNDEASSLTEIERSYEAASKVFTMLDTIMASALNLGDATTVS